MEHINTQEKLTTPALEHSAINQTTALYKWCLEWIRYHLIPLWNHFQPNVTAELMVNLLCSQCVRFREGYLNKCLIRYTAIRKPEMLWRSSYCCCLIDSMSLVQSWARIIICLEFTLCSCGFPLSSLDSSHLNKHTGIINCPQCENMCVRSAWYPRRILTNIKNYCDF